tara:strand:- start:195 stop:680 length:486 start_codon:yes stop_codon:yes gene_type:complete
MNKYPKKIDTVSVDYVEKKNYNFKTEQTNNHKNPSVKNLPVHTTILQTFLSLDKFSNLNILENELSMDIEYASMIIQKPGSINVTHRDEFFKLKDKNREKIRANIFLTDWEFGQLVETECLTITRWEKYSAYVWNNEVSHFAINFSDIDKITLQFSGYCNE